MNPTLAMLLTALPAAAADINEFIDFSVKNLPGRLYVPPEASEPDATLPLVLHLHGGGLRGRDNKKQLMGGIDSLFAAAKAQGAFFYAPQTRGIWQDKHETALAMQQIDLAIRTYNIDPERVYATGFSMGGGGVWNMLNRYPDRFAAGLAVAGISPARDFKASNVLGLPMWVIHARDDDVVSEKHSRQVIKQILRAARKRAPKFPRHKDKKVFEYVNDQLDLRYSEWPKGGHVIWPGVYADPQIADWLFAQSLADPEPKAAPVSSNKKKVAASDDAGEANSIPQRYENDATLRTVVLWFTSKIVNLDMKLSVLQERR
ncbi:MAG: PHB depolymerase family esterase [Planctomycetota bacterium]